MVPIGTRAKFLRISCIVCVVILPIVMALFGVILGWFAPSEGMDITENIVMLSTLIIIETLFGAVLIWQIIFLILIERCPKNLVFQEGDIFRLFIKGVGFTTLPCAAVTAVRPINVWLTAGFIGLANGKYDATLEITTTDGKTCRVPFVRYAPQVADAMMRIAYEVRMRGQMQAFAPQPQPIAPTDSEINQ